MDATLQLYTASAWKDPTEARRVWTLSDKWNTFIKIFIGICFGLAQPFLQRLVAHLLASALYSLGLSDAQSGQDRGPDDQTGLLSNAQRWKKKSRHCFNGHCFSEVAAFIIAVSVVVFGIAFSVAGTFADEATNETAALSASKDWGLWTLEDDANSVAQDEDDLLVQGPREMAAAQYAEDCYGSKSSSSSGQCTRFRHSVIPRKQPERGLHCPFVNQTYCAGNASMTVRFTTDLVDASHIGVRGHEPPKLNRTTLCVPLNVDANDLVYHYDDLPAHWEYNFGSVNGTLHQANYTFRQQGDPWDWDIRSYTMSTYLHTYHEADDENYWKPSPAMDLRPELTYKAKPYSITIMFINSCRIYYQGLSGDPIFPANRQSREFSGLYTNYDSRARPLVCIDWSEVCTNKGDCHPIYDDKADDNAAAGTSYLFTRLSMPKSDAFHTVEFRGANGRDAQKKIIDDISLQLPKDQWIVQSQALFDASLSRIQHDAWNIAGGFGSEKTNYVPRIPEKQRDRIFTFQVPKGYANIRIWPTLGILLIPLFVTVLGWQTGVEFDEDKKKSEYFGEDTITVLEWLLWKLCSCCGKRSKSDDTNRQSDETPEQTPGSGVRTYDTDASTRDTESRSGSLHSNSLAADNSQVVQSSNRSTHSNRSADITGQDDRIQHANGTPSDEVEGPNASDNQAPDTASRAVETSPSV